ncbi:MAG: PQQ-dependent sugar dehydrogenase [Demequinaceae bacterium]|nr:PQQ-dependent sugar dehydrogenase [Demequinaceae bacterium]
MKRTLSGPIATGILLFSLSLAACSVEPTPSPSPSPSPSDSPSPSANPSPSPSPSPSVVEPSGAATASVVDSLTIQDGLFLPWDIAFAPDGTMLVTISDSGQILRYKDGEYDYLVGEGADWLRGQTNPAGEGGLLGIAILPSNPNVLYVYVTGPSDNSVVRMQRFGQYLDEPTVILSGIPRANYHDGGRIRFGPDGYLYIATGDAGIKPYSQDLTSLAGKILRVVADNSDEDGQAAPGNPFGTRVWSYGHRNVQGLGWTSDGRMYASELGWNTQDELNLIEPGNNYGWPNKEGMVGAPAGTAKGQTVGGYTYPVATWATSEASPSGIGITDEGIYIGALRGQRIWRVPLTADGIGTPHVLLSDLGRIRLVTSGPNGNLYALTSNSSGANGAVDKIVRIVVIEND